MLIYIIFLTSFILSLIATKRKNIFWVGLLILLLSCFVGFRGIEVGDDTETYYRMFNSLRENDFSKNVEPVFLCLSYVILKLSGGVEAIFFVFALITNACIVVRLWTYRNKVPFYWTCLLYTILYYPQTCNIMRQYLAVSVIFLATILMDRRKYISFAVVVLLMTLIHRSSVVAVFLIPLHILFSEGVSVRLKKNFIKTSLYISPLVLLLIVFVFIKYSSYFRNSNNSFGLMNTAKAGALMLCSFAFCKELFFVSRRTVSVRGELLRDQSELLQDNRFILICCFIGVVFSFLGYFRTTLVRVGLSFSLYETLFIPLVCFKNRKGGNYAKILYAVIVGYFFVVNAISGWSELGNYSSIFGASGGLL